MVPAEPFRWSEAEQAAVRLVRKSVTFDGQFYRVQIGRWLVKTDVSSRFTAEVAAFYHIFEKMFTDAVPGAKLDKQSVTVMVFANKLDYVAVPNHPESSGTTHSDEHGICIYTYIPPKQSSEFVKFDHGTLIHEGVHAMLRVHFGRRHVPVWVHEGMASYFEPWSPHRTRENNIAGRMQRSQRMAHLAEAWKRGDRNIPSVPEILDVESGTWSAALGKDSGRYNYAMAEAWMAYLLSTLEGAAAFVDYFQDLSLGDRVPPFRLGDHPEKFERYFWIRMTGSPKAPRPLRSPPAKPTTSSEAPEVGSLLEGAADFDDIIAEMTVKEAEKQQAQARELLDKRQYETADQVALTIRGVVEVNRKYLPKATADRLLRESDQLRQEILARRKLAAYRIPETTGEFQSRLRLAEARLRDGRFDAAEQAIVEAKIFVENRADSLDAETRSRLYQAAESLRARVIAARRKARTGGSKPPDTAATGVSAKPILLIVSDWSRFTSSRTENADAIEQLQPTLADWLRRDAAGWERLETYTIVGQGRGNWPAGRSDSAVCRDDTGAKTREDRHADGVDMLSSRVEDLVRLAIASNHGIPIQVVVLTPYQAHKCEAAAAVAPTGATVTWVVLAGPEARPAKVKRQYPGAHTLSVSGEQLFWDETATDLEGLRTQLRQHLIAVRPRK